MVKNIIFTAFYSILWHKMISYDDSFTWIYVSICVSAISALSDKSTEENHSNEHASYEIPPVTNIFESPIILSLDSLLKKIA